MHDIMANLDAVWPRTIH